MISEENDFSSQDRYLTFFIGDTIFAVRADLVVQVIKYEKPSKLPQTPKFISGILPFRGEIIPIIDTRGNQNFIPNEYSIIVTIKINDKIFGIIADSIYEILKIEPSSIKPSAEFTNNKSLTKIIRGISMIEQMNVLIIDFDKVDKIDDLSSLLKLNEVVQSIRQKESR